MGALNNTKTTLVQNFLFVLVRFGLKHTFTVTPTKFVVVVGIPYCVVRTYLLCTRTHLTMYDVLMCDCESLCNIVQRRTGDNRTVEYE